MSQNKGKINGWRRSTVDREEWEDKKVKERNIRESEKLIKTKRVKNEKVIVVNK